MSLQFRSWKNHVGHPLSVRLVIHRTITTTSYYLVVRKSLIASVYIKRKIKNDFDFSSHFCSKKSNFHVKPKIIPLSTTPATTRTHITRTWYNVKFKHFSQICIIKTCFKFVAGIKCWWHLNFPAKKKSMKSKWVV